MELTRNYTLVASGLLGALGPLIGNGLYSGPDSDSGDAIIEEFADGLPAIGYVAIPLELLGFVGLTVFISCLVVRLHRAAPVAAVTTAVAGSAMLAVKMGFVSPWLVLVAQADELDPGTAAALMSLSGAAFVVSGLLLGLSFAAAGVGLLRTDTPRFLAWWAAGVGTLTVVAGVIGVTSPDNYLPIPFVLLLVWMIALAVATAMRPSRDRIETEEQSDRPVAATQ